MNENTAKDLVMGFFKSIGFKYPEQPKYDEFCKNCKRYDGEYCVMNYENGDREYLRRAKPDDWCTDWEGET